MSPSQISPTASARPRWRAHPLATLVVLLAVTLYSPLAAIPAHASTTDEARLLTSVNTARRAAGLAPLKVSTDLRSTARTHAAKMMSRGTLFHTADFRAVCCWTKIAENVGSGSSTSAVHRAFMSSSLHRANILMATADEIGIGVVRDDSGVLWVTELFRDRPGVHAAPPTSPTAARSPMPPSRSKPRIAPPVDATAARIAEAADALAGSAYRDPVRQAIDWVDAMAVICR